MKLDISINRTIHEVQQDFNKQYPFLKLEFYKMEETDSPLQTKKHLPHSMQLRTAGLVKSGVLEIRDEMSVEDLEKTFLQRFGLVAQVSRQSGIIWLETTMTDNWSLSKQNEYGREITLVNKKKLPDESLGKNM